MPHPFRALPARAPQSGLVHVLIDTPKGSRNKFKFDEDYGVYRLSRILPAGAIPRTRAEDGDALDVLVLMEAPSFPGCLITVRLIGALSAQQTEKGRTVRNDRLVAVPRAPVNRSDITRLADLDANTLHEIEHFFASCNRAQGRQAAAA